MAHRGFSSLVAIGLALLCVTACGDPTTTSGPCATRVPIAMITQTLRAQADVVGGQSASDIRGDLEDTIAALGEAKDATSSEIEKSMDVVLSAATSLRDALRDVDWDVANALAYEAVDQALTQLEGVDVATANIVVESFFLAQCGANTVNIDESSVQTLPTPTGVATLDSEPETGVVDNDSDARAIGLIVGQLFSLTLDTEQIDCLGEKLQNFTDLSDATSSPAQYQRQFQSAFDACRIDFTVPEL